ncbi:SDR family oxidoreductase (plasmid) [Aminobacter sp. BA135]|uniref:SDR family oxidoreductase n=1 Tax=Aminobacter sp. BA135 TaxID=537596 RepID=UPI003D79519F
MDKMKLDGRVALVTGGSRGLGRSIAIELSRAGAAVLIVGRDSNALDETVRLVRHDENARVAKLEADLTEIEAAASSVAAAISQFGHLDILVNCAGATKRGDFLELSNHDWEDGFALKFHGSVRLARAAWPHLCARAGSVINIVGVSSRTPTADFTIGSSVNSALLAFTKALADRGIEDGVRVNAINPGYIRTDRLTHRLDTLAKERGSDRELAEKELLQGYGIKRFGDPEGVAHLAVFLASSQAAYIHGATLDIDGGATRGI